MGDHFLDAHKTHAMLYTHRQVIFYTENIIPSSCSSSEVCSLSLAIPDVVAELALLSLPGLLLNESFLP